MAEAKWLATFRRAIHYVLSATGPSPYDPEWIVYSLVGAVAGTRACDSMRLLDRFLSEAHTILGEALCEEKAYGRF